MPRTHIPNALRFWVWCDIKFTRVVGPALFVFSLLPREHLLIGFLHVCRGNWRWEDNKPSHSKEHTMKHTSGGLAISLSACEDSQMAGDSAVRILDIFNCPPSDEMQCNKLRYFRVLNCELFPTCAGLWGNKDERYYDLSFLKNNQRPFCIWNYICQFNRKDTWGNWKDPPKQVL